ncbi:MAG: RNA polymerase sigma-70 factor [Bacteroidales bacterium]|nr:RNA polymerase sigma-70 factor [Bacteroides sp.]MCM1198351.1 RNA polymerase sigma-70 factor [Clostridium sp.]MCM1503009.1 RNA polymerase sigma-70 factor [Bacteroidales bacterium]
MIDKEREDILLLKTGDVKAFERLYRKYWAKVYHYAGLFIHNPAEQEDLTQQVFLKIWEIRESLDEARSLNGLLFIITRNFTFNTYSKFLNIDAVKRAEELSQEYVSTDLQSMVEARSLESYINQLVDCLPPRQREAFLLSRVEGLTYKEIAQRMEISVKAVEKNISLALKFIRSNLYLLILFCTQGML